LILESRKGWEITSSLSHLTDWVSRKVANRGECMSNKWHVSRGYLKIHVEVDIRKKKIILLEVTTEEVHDSRVMKKLVDHASENYDIKRVIAEDGAYDSKKKNFRSLHANNIEAAI
jgi:hypothetical protein